MWRQISVVVPDEMGEVIDEIAKILSTSRSKAAKNLIYLGMLTLADFISQIRLAPEGEDPYEYAFKQIPQQSTSGVMTLILLMRTENDMQKLAELEKAIRSLRIK